MTFEVSRRQVYRKHVMPTKSIRINEQERRSRLAYLWGLETRLIFRQNRAQKETSHWRWNKAAVTVAFLCPPKRCQNCQNFSDSHVPSFHKPDTQSFPVKSLSTCRRVYVCLSLCPCSSKMSVCLCLRLCIHKSIYLYLSLCVLICMFVSMPMYVHFLLFITMYLYV